MVRGKDAMPDWPREQTASWLAHRRRDSAHVHEPAVPRVVAGPGTQDRPIRLAMRSGRRPNGWVRARVDLARRPSNWPVRSDSADGSDSQRAAAPDWAHRPQG